MTRKGQVFWNRVLLLGSSVLMLFPGDRAAIASISPHLDRAQALNPHLELPPLGTPAPFLPEVQDSRLVLRLRDRRVYYYLGEEVIASYPVAIGRQGWETPTGSFAVLQKVPYPTWQHPFTNEIIPPGPANPLGDRWIGFWTDGKNYIGFHGTPNEELIGQAVSHGCVRMRNSDIVALYEKVEMGTPVIVEP
jgi:lipoprotein-anchoring transpeptidase ErfK/SrfK